MSDPGHASASTGTSTEDVVVDSFPENGPVQVVDFDRDTRRFKLYEERVNRVLCNPLIKDLPVSVISIAGPFRKGKSFMLNFFLRYVQHQDQEEWMGDMDAPLQGFKWRGGRDPETSGIWIWSKAFVRTMPDGKKVALVLMDTQGTFDHRTTHEQNQAIFALNSLLSSHQVYNVSMQLQEDRLTQMHMFTLIGKMIADSMPGGDDSKPFQAFKFLVRDWYAVEDYAYGADGGQAYLAEVLDDNREGMPEELRGVRKFLPGCYEELTCYLMPFPGQKVAMQSKAFEGNLGVIDEEFRNQLKDFIPRVCADRNLLIKKIGGKEMNCGSLAACFKEYLQAFASCEDLNAGNIVESQTRVLLGMVQKRAFKLYKEDMAKHTQGGHVAEKRLQELHEQTADKARVYWSEELKIPEEALLAEFAGLLDEEIDKEYEQIVKANEDKNVMRWIKTPLTLVGIAILCNILGTILSILYLEGLAMFLSMVTFGCLLLAGFYVYSRYSGDANQIADSLDEFALYVFEYAQQNVIAYLMGADAPPFSSGGGGSGGGGRSKRD